MSGTTLLVAVVTTLAAVTGLVVAVSWVFARLWCRPARRPRRLTPADRRLESEEVSFASRGVALAGWFVPGADGQAPWPAVVLVHGWSSNAAENLPIASALRQAGLATLLFDARGHGASSGDGPITILKLAEDVLAAVSYLAARADVDAARLGVLGRSIGGSAALLAASMEPRIAAVASCAAFADPRALTMGTLKWLHLPAWPFGALACRFIEHWLATALAEVAPVNRIGNIAAPVLLVHGAADAYIPPCNLDLLWARARQDHTERLLVPGRGHSDVTRDPSVRVRITTFFATHLSARREGAAEERRGWAPGKLGTALRPGRSDRCCGLPIGNQGWREALLGSARRRRVSRPHERQSEETGGRSAPV